jgi:hypothetical protein
MRSKDWRCAGDVSHPGEIALAGSRRLRSSLAAVLVIFAPAVATETEIGITITITYTSAVSDSW